MEPSAAQDQGHPPAAAGDADLLTLTKGRVEAFSDGVIAVAATLLVLEIKEPGLGTNIWVFLGGQLFPLAAYATSFLTILIFWVNHHALFHTIHRVDRTLLFLNGMLLLAITFISYATAVLGQALKAGHYDKSAAVLYALAMGVASACFTGLWAYLAARPHLHIPAARPRVPSALRRSLIGPSLYSLAGVVALFDAQASLAVDTVVALYFALLPRHLRRDPPVRTTAHAAVHPDAEAFSG